ncbi:MAG: hypothetical protein FWH27_15080 [Planctomycetaceae bacterium]|nr:hypothetical protein [Planctomycetaceae bacterium]
MFRLGFWEKPLELIRPNPLPLIGRNFVHAAEFALPHHVDHLVLFQRSEHLAANANVIHENSQ